MQREDREMIYSKRVRAGKRTYFFDVKATRAKDYFLTVTESRRQERDGEFYYEKSKLFIYKEDLNKFVEALQDTVNHIKTELLPDFDFDQYKDQGEYKKPVQEPAKTESIEEKSEEKPEVKKEESSDNFSSSELKWD